MSVTAVGGGAGYPPPVQSSPPAGQAAVTPPAPKAGDADHDGDKDSSGRLDVKA